MDELSIQELSDEDLAKLVQLGQIPEQQAMLIKQMQQAQALQQRPGPQMRGEGGRVQTAANPLEFIGAGLQQYAGMKREKEAQAKMDALMKQQLQGRQLYADRSMDTPYRRSTQPFIQPMTQDPSQNVPNPAMQF